MIKRRMRGLRRMEKLLSCPECGGKPKLNSLEPEYSSMKYFCSNNGVHISCGDWKNTDELAIVDWNSRVREYQETQDFNKEVAGMPEYFWEWYESKGYVKVLSIEECFENKAFLVGCCIEFLTEKGQKITKIQDCNNFKEIVNYLQTGVAWTR